MKKIVALLVAAMMLFACAAATADTQIGQSICAAHGTKCFSVLTVAVEDGVIVDAYIDEFQMMDAAAATPVANSEPMFPDEFAAGKVLASKRANAELYSENMKNNAGATLPLNVSYDSIEKFVIGKTVAELADIVAGFGEDKVAAQQAVDAVSSCTLADTLGYMTGLLNAAKTVTGVYTVTNSTGEAVELKIKNNTTGEETVINAEMAADATETVMFTAEKGTMLTLTFKTAGGYEGHFDTLAIETAPIWLLPESAVDAETHPTMITFRAPAAE